jgi:RHS repeat-associated protein
MTNDGSNTLGYDAADQLLSTSNSASSAAYTYDGNGLRVEKAVTGGASTIYIFSGTKVIAEYDNGAAVSSPTREHIYSGSQLLATLTNTGTAVTTTYHHPDQLSVRLDTDGTAGSPTYGQAIGQQGHYPFGESWYDTGSTTKFKFTTYERDPETGNDFAMARFNSNRLGRFTSPDPLAGSAFAPQSLNRYSYALNDPVNLADPSGALTIPVWEYACMEVEGGPEACGYVYRGDLNLGTPLPQGRSGEGGGRGGPKNKAKKPKCDVTVPSDPATARLAQLAYAEGNGTPTGALAVASVVVNRANYGNPGEFGEGIMGAINTGFRATNNNLFNSVGTQAQVSKLNPADCTRYKNAATAAVSAQVPGGTNTDAQFFFDISQGVPQWVRAGITAGTITQASIPGGIGPNGYYLEVPPGGFGVDQIFFMYTDFNH